MKWLFKPIDISSLVFFRIAFGVLGFIDILSTLIHKHWIKQSFDPSSFQFIYYGFQWLSPIAEPWMSILFFLLLLSSIGILLGKWYQLSTTFFAFGFSYLFLLEKAYYLNHGYLFCVLSFLMILLPAHRAFSLDALKKPDIRTKYIPYCPL